MNIYVGNLSYDVQQNDLQTLFEQYGEVASASVITDRDTGRSKGFGFVEMPQSAQAQKAVGEINGQSLQGRNVTVNEARPRERRPMRNSW
ncbi:MAG: RNA recognition motif domain-containing protein [Chitinivibrionales bacterium]